MFTTRTSKDMRHDWDVPPGPSHSIMIEYVPRPHTSADGLTLQSQNYLPLILCGTCISQLIACELGRTDLNGGQAYSPARGRHKRENYMHAVGTSTNYPNEGLVHHLDTFKIAIRSRYKADDALLQPLGLCRWMVSYRSTDLSVEVLYERYARHLYRLDDH